MNVNNPRTIVNNREQSRIPLSTNAAVPVSPVRLLSKGLLTDTSRHSRVRSDSGMSRRVA
jgi:hypothetical protein